jgi:hypothetical protein
MWILQEQIKQTSENLEKKNRQQNAKLVQHLRNFIWIPISNALQQ